MPGLATVMFMVSSSVTDSDEPTTSPLLFTNSISMFPAAFENVTFTSTFLFPGCTSIRYQSSSHCTPIAPP